MSSNNFSQFLDRFEKLGLSRNESSVYLALLKNYPVTGYKLAKDSGILRPIVYEMLTRLVEKGGVKIVKDTPEQYAPVSPEIFLASLEKSFIDARISLAKELASLDISEKNDDFWNLSNKDAIIANIKNLVSKTKKNILLYINNADYAQLLQEILSKKVASGIKIICFSYRNISLPGTDLYTYKIDLKLENSMINDNKILIVADNDHSIVADMDMSKACETKCPIQVETIAEYIRMKIVIYRICHILTPQKLSLYLFDEDKHFFKKFL